MEPGDKKAGARVILAASCYTDAQAALDLATLLARQMGRELVGLLVEEQAVHFHASMPFARTVATPGTTREEITAKKMQDAFARDAREFEARLRMLGEQENLSWSFRTMHGKLRIKGESEATAEDFLILGGHLSRSHKSAILVVFGPHADPALVDLSTQIASDTDHPIIALVAADETTGAIQEPNFPPALHTKTLAYGDNDALFRLVGRTGAAALIISAECRQRCDLERLIEAARCPVIIAGGPTSANP